MSNSLRVSVGTEGVLDSYRNLLRGLGGLRYSMINVGKVMRKYGEEGEREGMVDDANGDLSAVDQQLVWDAGMGEEARYWEWLEGRSGSVMDVADYLWERFSGEGDDGDKVVHVCMLEWVLEECRKLEGREG